MNITFDENANIIIDLNEENDIKDIQTLEDKPYVMLDENDVNDNETMHENTKLF